MFKKENKNSFKFTLNKLFSENRNSEMFKRKRRDKIYSCGLNIVEYVIKNRNSKRSKFK